YPGGHRRRVRVPGVRRGRVRHRTDHRGQRRPRHVTARTEEHAMDQQEMADLLEIRQLAARYMMLAARKDNDHWLEVFTADGVYNAFGTPYGLEHFPMLLKSAPPGQYIGNAPVVEFHGDTATGV